MSTSSVLLHVPPTLHGLFIKATLDGDHVRALDYVYASDRIDVAVALLGFLPQFERPALRAQIAKWRLAIAAGA